MTTKIARAVLVTAVTIGICGCTPEEEKSTVLNLQAALNSLTQNRSLTEQFVRDIKSNVDPTEPSYQQAMESYETARDSYNQYLDTVELSRKESRSFQIHHETKTDVRNATADFLADATSALKPSINTRRVQFQRAVIIPDNLQISLQKLPKHVRAELVTEFDKQVRWRSWGQL